MIAAVVLAAGGSSRLGQPKQLVRHRGRTLVRATVEAALAGGCRPVVVVLGAQAEAVRAEVADLPVRCATNAGWRSGMGSSIGAGMRALGEAREPGVRAALLLACDQPRLTPGLVRRLCAAFDGVPGRTVACAYAGRVGIPALFERGLFDRLEGLAGDRGARGILHEHPENLIALPWPAGAFDLDAPEQLARLGGEKA